MKIIEHTFVWYDATFYWALLPTIVLWHKYGITSIEVVFLKWIARITFSKR